MPKTIERLSLILSMKKNFVDISLLQDYASDTLDKLCKGIEKHKMPAMLLSNCIAIQKELINDEQFFFYLDKLAAAQITYTEVNRFLSELHSCGDHGTDYPINQLISSMILTKRSTSLFCDYLKYFSGMATDKEQKSNIISNLGNFSGSLEKQLSELTDTEKSLFMESCLTNRPLIPKEFSRAFELLQQNRLLEILRFININEYDVSLSIDNYEAINKNAEEIFKHFKQFQKRLSRDYMEMLIERWLDNNCYLYDLDVLWSKADELCDAANTDVLNDRSGYINLIYGNTINGIPLAIVPRHKEDILVHAVAQGKSGFLRLIEENKALFESIGEQSILYSLDFYTKHFDLDTMSVEDLGDCIRMEADDLHFNCLENGKVYTFDEIKALYGLSTAYYKLYTALATTPIDNRLAILKQMSDSKLLAFIIEDESINNLAARLSLKPLTEWLDNEFAQIKGLTMLDAVQLLVSFDEVSKLVPHLKSSIESKLLIRNKASAQNYATIADMEKDLNKIDDGWITLVEQLGFSDDFLSANKQHVYKFLCDGNAEIAGKYYDNLYEDADKDLFKQIVEADLVGELRKLKYNEEELLNQIDFPLSMEQQSAWQENTDVCKENITVSECDDFNSTMTLGDLSSRPNLSYRTGRYCECLLSGFDSNKKVLFASVDNRNVGNAIVRLTKCKAKTQDGAEQERLILFLERSYADDISSNTKAEIDDMYFDLMDKKAKKMGVMLVLSTLYDTMDRSDLTREALDIYISKAKSGAQYLDSLSSRGMKYYEGGYKSSDFIVRLDDVLQGSAAED